MLLLKDIIILGLYFISLYFSVFWILFFIDKYSEIVAESKKTFTPKKHSRVTIAIPAYNEEKTIRKTLESVAALNYPRQLVEIIVVNDGSKDRTEEEIQRFIRRNEKLNIIYQKTRNHGKASALNHALNISTGEYFVCLDADSFVDKNALTQSIGFIQKDPKLVIVTPVMHVEKPSTILQKLQKIEYLVAMLIVKLMGYIDSNFIAPGPFSLYKTQVIKDLGGFDEENLTEDQELAYRAQSRHLKIRQCPSAIVHTNAPSTFFGLYKQRNRWFKGSLQNIFKYKKLIMNKNYGDFGMFQMPVNISAFILAIFSIGLFLYTFIKPIILWLNKLYLLNFDMTYFITDWSFNFSLLNIDILNWYIILSFLLLSGFLFYMANKIHGKSIKEHSMIVLIPYFFVYFMLLSTFAVIVMIESAFGVKQKW